MTLGNLIASLGSLRAGNVKDAHIEFLREQLQVVVDRVKKLEEENTRLIAAQAEAEKELARHRKTAEAKQYRGALWVRKPSGGYEETPLCPRCGNTMFGLRVASRLPYECGDPKCRHRANFSGRDIAQILKELAAERDGIERHCLFGQIAPCILIANRIDYQAKIFAKS